MSIAGKVMSRHDTHTGPGVPCDQCEGSGLGHNLPRRMKHAGLCLACDGIGFHGVDPYQTSGNLPGTTGRVGLMAARYRSGLPIWHAEDRRNDSPPGEVVDCPLSAGEAGSMVSGDGPSGLSEDATGWDDEE